MSLYRNFSLTAAIKVFFCILAYRVAILFDFAFSASGSFVTSHEQDNDVSHPNMTHTTYQV